MPSRTPTTVYLDPKIARAMKVKAALTGKSLSDLANEAFKRILRDDDRILRLVKSRRKQVSRPYEEFIAELRADGLI